MNFQLKTITTLLVALTLLLPLSATADSITLRRSVRLPVNQTELTLADIATLQGDAAIALGDTVVFDLNNASRSSGSVNEIELAAIRKLLTDRGIHWGQVHLSGRNVLVRPVGGTSLNPADGIGGSPIAMQPVSLDGVESQDTPKSLTNTIAASSLIDESTLRGVVARRIATALATSPDAIRFEFDATQQDLLATTTQDYQIELEPLSELTSDQVEIAVRFWKDGNMASEDRISVKPMLQRSVMRMQQPRKRGERIRPQDVSTTNEWQTPSAARLFDASPDLINQMAVRNLSKGDLLRPRDLQPERIIKRGDRVKVRCLSGGVVIALEAEARNDAGLGEEVELKRFGERDTFYAVVSAPGQATIDVQQSARRRVTPPLQLNNEANSFSQHKQNLEPMWKE